MFTCMFVSPPPHAIKLLFKCPMVNLAMDTQHSKQNDIAENDSGPAIVLLRSVSDTPKPSTRRLEAGKQKWSLCFGTG